MDNLIERGGFLEGTTPMVTPDISLATHFIMCTPPLH